MGCISNQYKYLEISDIHKSWSTDKSNKSINLTSIRYIKNKLDFIEDEKFQPKIANFLIKN